MPHSYAVRITYPKETVRHVINVWTTQCEKVAAFEHTDAKKVHCHLLIINSRIEKKQLRNIASKCGVDLKGNANMSFKAYDENETYITYMTKGVFSPFYLQGFTQEECEEAKKQWTPRQGDPLKTLYKQFEVSIDFQGKEFKDYIEEVFKISKNTTEDLRFNYVRSRAHKSVLLYHKGWANPRFFNDYKTFVYTFCFANNISIPKDWHRNY